MAMDSMEYHTGAGRLAEAAQAAGQQGPGNLLRIVLIVMVVGCVLAGWFLLRGYRRGADEEHGLRSDDHGLRTDEHRLRTGDHDSRTGGGDSRIGDRDSRGDGHDGRGDGPNS